MSATEAKQPFISKEWPMKHALKLVTLSELGVDRDYQRDERDIAQIIGADFDPLAFGAIVVAKRKNGSLWIVDGQQRAIGARIAGFYQVPALVFDSSGSREEAALFRKVNAFRRKVSSIEVFRAALHAKIPQALEVSRVVTQHGFEIPFKKKKRTKWPFLGGVSVLLRIHSQGGVEGLDKTLAILKELWPEEDEACSEEFVKGLFLFLNDTEDLDLGKAKSKLKGTPVDVIRRMAKSMQVQHPAGSGFARYEGVRDALYKLYRKGLKKK